MLGAIAISDSARPEARHAVTTLQQHGIKTILLTGDNQPAATAIGRSLGITEIEAGLLPDQKLDRIQTLVEAGNIVAMVGDGINDAPALLAANVGVAMGSGTDIAHESGDVLLIGNDLTRFVDALALAQHARIIIYQNFAGTIGIDLAGIGLAAFGLLNPVLAALVHVTSELAFLLNSARLLPSPQRRRR
jgi:Cd2+/Zn2+-exporting ATPase/Cu+-exporting ATPase